ncbi:MAG: flagellar hook capping FlgD N-terminal domain-containing protein [Candidatus Sericytochromatia bacterium]|nr:flagellar hook capping FlgD N-terminal domain-containing protein [Candidatus Sericytochromatia bacterium]
MYALQSIVPTPPPSLRGAFREDEKPEEDFIRLMVAQLQNQDPEKPMDGTALITQLMQMNAAIATNRVSWLTTENHLISTAASMLGRQVKVRDPQTGAVVTGRVESVDYNEARPVLEMNGQRFPVEHVVQVMSPV